MRMDPCLLLGVKGALIATFWMTAYVLAELGLYAQSLFNNA